MPINPILCDKGHGLHDLTDQKDRILSMTATVATSHYYDINSLRKSLTSPYRLLENIFRSLQI